MTKFSEQFDALSGQKNKIIKDREDAYLKCQQDLFHKWWNKTKCEILWQLLDAKEAIEVDNPNKYCAANGRTYVQDIPSERVCDYKIFKKMCAERGFILGGQPESWTWTILRAQNQNPDVEDEIPDMSKCKKNVVSKPKKPRSWWQKFFGKG